MATWRIVGMLVAAVPGSALLAPGTNDLHMMTVEIRWVPVPAIPLAQRGLLGPADAQASVSRCPKYGNRHGQRKKHGGECSQGYGASHTARRNHGKSEPREPGREPDRKAHLGDLADP